MCRGTEPARGGGTEAGREEEPRRAGRMDRGGPGGWTETGRDSDRGGPGVWTEAGREEGQAGRGQRSPLDSFICCGDLAQQNPAAIAPPTAEDTVVSARSGGTPSIVCISLDYAFRSRGQLVINLEDISQ